MKSPKRLRLAVALAVVALGFAPLRADLQTLTDAQGRSIKANVLSVENGKVRIKRDDGQTFELPLASLNDDTQSALKAWAEKAASEIPAGAITVELSRGVFDTNRTETISTVTNEELWGYSVTVTNRRLKPITNLRFDYVLFVKPDVEPGKDAKAASLKKTQGTASIASIAAGTKTLFRTDGIKIYKQKLKPGWIWGKTGNAEMLRDTLYGVWIKAYAGDQLVAEICSPEGLAKTEKGP